MKMLVFPAAFMANTFAMMLVMIGLSVFGRPELAADFGLIHGATVALFYSFSGNARSLILGEAREIKSAEILRVRCLMVLPLSAMAFILSIGVVESGWLFVLLLVGRRSAEWLAEVFISEQELHHRKRPALIFFIVQGVLSLILLLVLVEGGGGVPMMLIWSVSPLFGCINGRLIKKCAARDFQLLQTLKLLLPHFGSTAVIGVSVYVFRLFILLVVGTQIAGDLFAAFAMGGILGAVFAQALGPTMVRRERGVGVSGRLSKIFSWAMVVSVGLGLMLLATAGFVPEWLEWTQKSTLFWLAVGCSLLGGVVTVLAQRIRLRMLQDGLGGDVFGSDMLANIFLITSIPFFFYGAGAESLTLLYLFGAVLSLSFYSSEREGLLLGRLNISRIYGGWQLYVLAIVLFIPLFFQLAGGLYRSDFNYFGSGGNLALLPIPVSILACYGGIVLLGRYSQVRLSLISLFFVFMGMLLTSALLAASAGGYEKSKLILLVQYMLPMFALVLGQQFGSRPMSAHVLARVILFLLMIVMSLQLASTLVKGTGYLSSSLFLFSVYQHLQYVPVLFVGMFLIVIFSLWDSQKYQFWSFVLALLMGVYAALSVSMLAMTLLVTGMLGFVVHKVLSKRYARAALILFFVTLCSFLLGFLYMLKSDLVREKFGVTVDGAWERSPQNVGERLVYWRFYFEGVMENWRTFLFGHAEAPDRKLYPSAHNYYLDIAYNFGFIALLPLLVLVGFTVLAVLRYFMVLWRGSYELGLAGVVIFLLVVDNAFKVGMRQPYPGIVTFFFWGCLLAVLLRVHQSEKARMALKNTRFCGVASLHPHSHWREPQRSGSFGSFLANARIQNL